MSIFSMLVKKGLRSVTLVGNIGKCPECGKIQFVSDIPELRELSVGNYTDLLWKCPKCECEMGRSESVHVPPSPYNRITPDISVEKLNDDGNKR